MTTYSDFEQTFKEDWNTCNVFRIKDTILFKFNIPILYDVISKVWDGNLYDLPDFVPIVTPDSKQKTFRDTPAGTYLKYYFCPNFTTTTVKNLLNPQNELFIEQSIKLNLPVLLKALSTERTSSIFKKADATSLVKASELNVKQLQIIQEELTVKSQDVVYYWKRLFDIFPTFKGIQDDLFKEILQIACSDKVSDESLRYYRDSILNKPGNLKQKLKKVLEYIDSNFDEYRILRDTLIGLNQRDDSLFPEFPKTEHISDLINQLHVRIQVAQDTEAYKEWNDQYLLTKSLLNLDAYQFTNGMYSIVIPNDISDLDIEGNALHHCVASYKDVVSKGKEIVLFLRKNSEINTPYYTIDLDTSGFIRQIHSKYNGNISEDSAKDSLQEFLNSWADCKSELINKKSLKLSYGAKCHL